MSVDATADVLVRAGELLEQQHYASAREAFQQAVDAGAGAPALVGLARAARALDDVPAALAALEEAYRQQVDARAFGEAGSVATMIADIELSERGAQAVAAGWLSRARSLLDEDPEHEGHVFLEGLSAYLALAYDKDPDRARDFAERGLAHARRRGDLAAVLEAQAYLGLVQVSVGDLQEGFALLDGASAAALAGEVEPMVGLDVYCVLLTACERVRDYDRVAQWAQRVLALASELGSDGFATFARTQYANLLIWRGRWDEADAEIERVLIDAEQRPLTAAMGMVLRASLRRRQGRYEEAAAQLDVAEREPYRRGVRHLVLAARARLELDAGNPQVAADLLERYLRLVSPRDRIERIEALEALVQARVELGEVDVAQRVLDELDEAAAVIPTAGVQGGALVARALLLRAGGDLVGAISALEDAAGAFDDAGLPHERAAARLVLAESLRDAGRIEEAGREASAARAEADALGAGREVAVAAALLATLRDRPAPGGLTARELEILRLIAEGRANADIAATLVLSVRTVERHVSNIYLKVGATGPSARAVAIAYARRHGLL